MPFSTAEVGAFEFNKEDLATKTSSSTSLLRAWQRIFRSGHEERMVPSLFCSGATAPASVAVASVQSSPTSRGLPYL